METKMYDAALCSNCGQCSWKTADQKKKQTETPQFSEEWGEGFPPRPEKDIPDGRDTIGDMLDDLFY